MISSDTPPPDHPRESLAPPPPPPEPSRCWLGRSLDQAHLAAVFLTRIPWPSLRAPFPSLASSLWAFPLVGALIGALSGAILWGSLALGLPASIAAGLALAASVLLTGALHEDGLADIADGFGGGSTRERKLEILRDSRVGSYGVVALILAFGLRWASLSALATLPLGFSWCPPPLAALIAAHAIARASVPWAMVLGQPARQDGLGASAGRAPLTMALLSLALASVIAAVVLPTHAVTAVVAMLVVTLALSVLAKRQIGGYTGDVLGAIVLLSETAILILAAR